MVRFDKTQFLKFKPKLEFVLRKRYDRKVQCIWIQWPPSSDNVANFCCSNAWFISFHLIKEFYFIEIRARAYNQTNMKDTHNILNSDSIFYKRIFLSTSLGISTYSINEWKHLIWIFSYLLKEKRMFYIISTL